MCIGIITEQLKSDEINLHLWKNVKCFKSKLRRLDLSLK